jgi:hypothetical protein
MPSVCCAATGRPSPELPSPRWSPSAWSAAWNRPPSSLRPRRSTSDPRLCRNELLRGLVRPAQALPLQSIALLGFGAAAAIAVFVDTDLGAYLVAAGLFGHSAWDLYHYRANRVVARSLAEFCLLLDAALAMLIVLATVME